MKKGDKSEAATLRHKAEVQLKKNHLKVNTPSSEQDIRKIVHEIQVQKIELEIQNEELILANELAVNNAEKYIEFYDFAPSGYFTLSKEGRIIGLNLKGASILGKERQRLLNTMLGGFVSHGTKPIFNLFLSKVFKGKSNETCEVTLSGEGESVPTYFFLSGNVIKNGEQCQITMVDITERKQSEMALLESEERFQLLFNKAPLGYQSLDIDGNFIEVNQKWLDSLGYNRNEVIGKWFGDFLSPDYQDGFRKRFPIFKTKGHIHSEFEMVHKNGNILFIAFEGKIGYDTNGKFKQTHCILQDITERKQWVDALQKTEAKHSVMLSNISDVIGIIGADGIMKYKSSNIEKWFGWQPQDLVGTDGFSNVHADDLERVKTEFFTVLEKEDSSITLEFRYKCKDGSYKPIELTAKNLINDHIINGVLLNYHDITERKLAQDTIREKDIQFRKLSSNVPDLIFQFTRRPDGTYCVPIASEGIRNIFGCSPQDVLEDFAPIGRVIYPEDSARVISDIEYSAEHLSYFTCEFRVQIPGKAIQWIYSKSTPEKMADGSITWYGFNVDITARKLAQETIRESEEKFKSAFQYSAIGMALISPEGKWMKVNTSLCEIVGYSDEELMNLTFQDITHPDDLAADLKFVSQLLAGEIETYSMEKRYFHKQGNIVWILLAVSLVRDKAGVPLYFISQIKDITERKQTEKALKENEERLRDIIFSIGDWVWEVDQKGIYTYSSQQGTNILGFSRDEIVGKSPFDFMQQDEAGKIGEIFSEIVANKAPIKDLENWNIGKNGKKICLLTNGVPFLDNEGNLKGYRGVDKDITDFKKNEAALNQMNEVMTSLHQRLENIREEEQAQISRNIHDHLGQSLTSLKFDLGTLIDKTERGSNDNVKLAGMIEMVTQIIRNVQRISSELRPPALDELGLSAAMEWYCEEFMERTGLQLHLELDNVQTENKNKNLALYRVLQESLTNVIRHAGAKNIFIKLCTLGEDILLIIEDDGIGITPDKIKSVKSLGILGMFERIRHFGGDIEIGNPDKKGTEVKARLSVK